MLFAELLAKSPPSSWGGVASLTQPFALLALGRTGLLYLAPLALCSEIIIGKDNRVSNPYGVVINVIVLTHARLRQAWAMYSNRCRGMSLIGESQSLIAGPMVFEANQEIGVPGDSVGMRFALFDIKRRWCLWCEVGGGQTGSLLKQAECDVTFLSRITITGFFQTTLKVLP